MKINRLIKNSLINQLTNRLLMVTGWAHGSWLKDEGSWLVANGGRPGPVAQRRVRPGLGPGGAALGPGAGLAPLPMSHGS